MHLQVAFTYRNTSIPNAAFRHIRDLFRPPSMVLSPIILAALDDLGGRFLVFLEEKIFLQLDLCNI